jgi:hypothetical protein
MVVPHTEYASSLKNVKVFPNPFKISADWDRQISGEYPSGKRMYFTNLPKDAIIKIYTLGGDHIITFRNDTEGGDVSWDLRSRYQQEVVSGIYLYEISANGESLVDKIVLIR